MKRWIFATVYGLLADNAHAGSRHPQPAFISIQVRDATIGNSAVSALSINRGGYQDDGTEGDEKEGGSLSLEQKVRRAMQKLGITPKPPKTPPSDSSTDPVSSPVSPEGASCVDGVCTLPSSDENAVAEEATVEVTGSSESEGSEDTVDPVEKSREPVDPTEMANKMASDLGVDSSMAWAALAATSTSSEDGPRAYHEDDAREMIQQELEAIRKVAEDAAPVKQLVAEGFDAFLSRRALAFAEMDVDNARAILLADQEDEEEEEAVEAQQTSSGASGFKTVSVNANFDPTKLGTEAEKPAQTEPSPAKKEDVIFEATSAEIQELVLESPVPVLLDVYADWCGPCKALTPALEEMAIKAGGAFRLVKLNSDNEKAMAGGALQVKALPTVFGISGGKIRHRFQGMPPSQEFFQKFMMGLLVPGQEFDPPVTVAEQKEYDELSAKLLQTAGGASYSFGARERLQNRVVARLDELVEQADGDILDAENSAQTIRSLLSNAVRNPFEMKYRTVKLTNKVIAAKIGKFKAAVSILKSVGFREEGDVLIAGPGKKLISVAPLMVARDCIDKWIGEKRYEVAKAARQRKDEEDRQKLLEERAARGDDEEEESDDEEEEVDPDICSLNVRIAGKNKVHSLDLHADDDTLESILSQLPISLEGDQEVQFTCAARKLIVKSSDSESMSKSLRSLGLAPTAALVVSVVGSNEQGAAGLAERAASKKRKKKGSHTMQSIGIYAKDDNAKSELIDGGGGVWYEHDVTDDEEEANEEAVEDEVEEDNEKDAVVEDVDTEDVEASKS